MQQGFGTASAGASQEFVDLLRNPEKLTDDQLKDKAMVRGSSTAYSQLPMFWEMTALDPSGKTLQRIIDLHKHAVTGECSLFSSGGHGHFSHHSGQRAAVELAALCETTTNLEILMSHKQCDYLLELRKYEPNRALGHAISLDRAENVRLIVEMDPGKMLKQ